MAFINWSNDELQIVIDEIITGTKLVSIEAKSGPVDILFRYPSRKDIRNAEIQMRKTLERAIKNKFLTEEQQLQIIKDRGIWTEADENIVQELKEKKVKWKDKLKNPDLTLRSKLTIAEAIEAIDEKIFQAEYKKEIILANSAERKARQAKFEYLIWSSSYDPETEERYWENYLTYCRVMDMKLKSNLLTEFLKYLPGRSVAEIRFIARSSLWRINYVVAQKTNTPLFPVAVVDLTPDQTNLAWWTGYYESIWGMMPEDQPDDSIVQDDEALDKYMEELHKERTRERQDAKRTKGNPFGAKSARNMKEQLIMRSNPNYVDYEYDELPADLRRGTALEKNIKDESPVARAKASKLTGSKRFKPDNQ